MQSAIGPSSHIVEVAFEAVLGLTQWRSTDKWSTRWATNRLLHRGAFLQAQIEGTRGDDLWAEHFGFGFQKDVAKTERNILRACTCSMQVVEKSSARRHQSCLRRSVEICRSSLLSQLDYLVLVSIFGICRVQLT